VSWLRANQRTAAIVGLTLLLPVYLYLNTLFGFLGLRQEYQSEIDRQIPRIARLQGLIEHEEQLRQSAQAIESQMLSLAYPVAEDRAAVAARLQKDVRQILVEAGLSVTNSQVLPVKEAEMFDYIGLKVTVNGSLDGLDEALAELSTYTPLLLVESLEVWPNRSRAKKGEPEVQLLSASLQVLSLRAIQ
jgi:general secretion pathway protein M